MTLDELINDVGLTAGLYMVCSAGASDLDMAKAALREGIEAAIKAEREACAMVCENTDQEYEPHTGQPHNLSYTCATAIRARSEPKP